MSDPASKDEPSAPSPVVSSLSKSHALEIRVDILLTDILPFFYIQLNQIHADEQSPVNIPTPDVCLQISAGWSHLDLNGGGGASNHSKKDQRPSAPGAVDEHHQDVTCKKTKKTPPSRRSVRFFAPAAEER